MRFLSDMHSYRQRFFALLLPISILTSIISLFYLQHTYGHPFGQTLPLACVFGFLSGLVLAFIGAFFFLLPAQSKSTKANLSHRKNTKKTVISSPKEPIIPIDIPEKEITPKLLDEPLKEEPSIEESIKPKDTLKPTLYTLTLFMDKALSYETTLQAIEEYQIGTLIINDDEKDSLEIQMPSEVMVLDFFTLTRHTSKLTLRTIEHTKDAKKIMNYLKEKESNLF
jgi:hypothetical protein